MIHANAPGPRPWRERMRFAYLEPEVLTYLAIPGVALTASAIQTLNTNIQTIKGGGSVTLSAVTARWATVNTAAFVDAPSQDLRAYVGFKGTGTAGGKTAVFRIGGQGTAETLSPANLFANGDFAAGTDWTISAGTWAIGSGVATYNGAVASTIYQNVLTAGWLFKYGVSIARRASGTLQLRNTSLYTNIGTAVKAYTGYQTATGQMCGFNTSSADLDIDDADARRVLTPSTLGSLIYKLDGTTRSFESNDGIDPNTAWDIAIAKV